MSYRLHPNVLNNRASAAEMAKWSFSLVDDALLAPAAVELQPAPRSLEAIAPHVGSKTLESCDVAWNNRAGKN